MRHIGIVGKSRSGSGPESWKINLLHGFRTYQKDTAVCEINTVTSICSFFSPKKESRVLITYTQDIWSILVVCLNIFFKIPHIHVVHGDFYAEQASKKGVKKLLWLPVNVSMCTRSAIVVVPSGRLKNRLLQNHMIGKVEVIFNSYDIHKSSELPMLFTDQQTITCVTITSFTHFEKCRGIIDLVNYLNFIKADKKVHFLIIGGGTHLEYIRGIVNSIDGPITVMFLGKQNKEELNLLMKSSDLFLYCSYLDSGPLVVLEAIDAGLPVLSNEIGYTPELLTTDDPVYTGLYTDKDSFVELFRKISDDSVFRDAFVSAQQTVARRSFSTPCVQEQWSDLFYLLENSSRGK